MKRKRYEPTEAEIAKAVDEIRTQEFQTRVRATMNKDAHDHLIKALEAILNPDTPAAVVGLLRILAGALRHGLQDIDRNDAREGRTIRLAIAADFVQWSEQKTITSGPV